jgi:hypothetical protein
MIGVTRRQTWQRRGDGGTGSAEYRYYQCGSRTNQSMCDYHTRPAVVLDDEVRREAAAALERIIQGETLTVGAANQPDDPKRLRTRLRQLDRRLEQYLDLAAAGRLSPERLRVAGVELAREQLTVEDTLDRVENRARARAAETERLEERRRQHAALTEGWEAQDFAGRQGLLRDILERVRVHDDRVELVIRE